MVNLHVIGADLLILDVKLLLHTMVVLPDLQFLLQFEQGQFYELELCQTSCGLYIEGDMGLLRQLGRLFGWLVVAFVGTGVKFKRHTIQKYILHQVQN